MFEFRDFKLDNFLSCTDLTKDQTIYLINLAQAFKNNQISFENSKSTLGLIFERCIFNKPQVTYPPKEGTTRVVSYVHSMLISTTMKTISASVFFMTKHSLLLCGVQKLPWEGHPGAKERAPCPSSWPSSSP